MRQYRIRNTLTVAAGTMLGLSAEQVRRRRHQLEPIDPQPGEAPQWGPGRYRATTLVQFKQGEVVGIDGDLPKVHEPLVERLEEAPAESGPAPAKKRKVSR